MSTNKLTLLLAAIEAEVLEEALDLYVRARPIPIDNRFEYRYRAARSILESLRHGANGVGSFQPGDDDDSAVRDPAPTERLPRRERSED